MSQPKRILILGPASTGKSTLSADLAAHFREPWVPEFAREYLEKIKRPYRYEDLLEIGKGQIASEDSIAEQAEKLLFVDTDLRVIHIWSEHRFGKTDPWIMEELAKRRYELILLTDIDLPWTPDPFREHAEMVGRQYFFDKYLDLAKTSGFPYVVVSGDRLSRREIAIKLVEALQ